ncbi:MAG: PD-(D/E)XK nuclease family protein [Candidatus Thermoplasmatota archaeon]|nr:PD-(D/E)XK nuclease family protein [Candidatus Thermoplasmatota archaeon]
MPIYSHSRLGCYENCPRQYKFRYVEKIKPEEEMETIEAFLGCRVHEALEHLYKYAGMQIALPLEDVLAFYDAKWEGCWSDAVEVVNKEFSAKDYYRVGKKCVSDYYKRYYPFNERTLGLERLITIDLDSSGKYVMRGYIDRLAEREDGRYEIHDYKTSAFLPETDHFDADRQLALYQIGVEKNFRDAKSVELVWHYLRHDKEIRSKRTKEQIDELKKETISLIDNIEKATALDNFPAKESALCNWCEYQEFCPKRRHLTQTQQMTLHEFSNDDGVRLVEKYAQAKSKEKELEEQIEALKSAIVEFAHAKGLDAIYGKDRKVTVSERTGVIFPAAGEEKREALEKILKCSGKWDEISSLDTRALSKIILEKAPTDWDEKLLGEITKFAEKEKRYDVRLGKVKREEE